MKLPRVASRTQALEELRSAAGTQFDTGVVEQLEQLVERGELPWRR